MKILRPALSALILSALAVLPLGALQKDYVSKELQYKMIEKNPDFWINSPIVMDDIIIFFFKGDARKVLVAGDFNDWKPRLLMQQKNTNFWQAAWDIRMLKGVHKYKLLVDDIWMSDPQNTNYVIDDSGQMVSTFELKEDFIPEPNSPLWLKDDLYRFRYESIKAKSIYLVGDFNNWNPYNLMMTNTGSDEFFITIRLKPGLHSYCFVVDGEWKPDPDNLNQYSDEVGNIVSIINIRPGKRK